MNEQVDGRPPSSFLAVGLALQLSFSLDETRAGYGSSLLGWKEQGWLICEWPFHFGQPVSCCPGSVCLLRYLYGGKLIGYRSEVLSTHLQPFPFLLLAFPISLEEVSLRKHSRVQTNEPIVLCRVSNGVPASRAVAARIGGLLMDLSPSGCAVVLQRPMQDYSFGMLLRIEFEIVGVGHVSNLAAIVRNMSVETGGTQLGLEFRFDGKEAIEYRGWGGSVQKALEFFVLQKHAFESA